MRNVTINHIGYGRVVAHLLSKAESTANITRLADHRPALQLPAIGYGVVAEQLVASNEGRRHRAVAA